MSEQVPEHPVFIVDATIAIRAAREKDALDEIARRLRAVGRDRDTSCELHFPRTMLASTPLFSALERDKDARRAAPSERFSKEEREALELLVSEVDREAKEFQEYPDDDPAVIEKCNQFIAAAAAIRAMLSEGAEKREQPGGAEDDGSRTD